jgi:Phospholipase_D-nuclease N-terminal
MLAYSWPLLSLFWTFLEFAAVFLFVFFILWCFVGNFRRRDHHGAAKAIWTVVILFIPVIGAIVYVAVRPSDAQLTS